LPGDEQAYAFRHRERVRFRDVDLQRIVYYGKYLDFFDNAMYEYLRSLGFEAGEINARHGFDTSVVHVEIDYFTPARFDEVLEIGVRITRLGRSSLDASFDVRNRSGVVCRARLIMVNYDAETAKSRPIPAGIRDAVERTNEGWIDSGGSEMAKPGR
jgi:acyl-CoA thioester hydrolase